MGARGVRRTHSLNNRELTRMKERLERLEARMEAEKAIEVERRLFAAALRLRNGNRGTQAIIVWLGERNDYVETVHGAALEEDNELFLIRGGSSGDGALQERRHCSHADHGDAAALEEHPTRHFHG